jgi:hypothetical protein
MKPATLMELGAITVKLCSHTEDLCRHVITNISVRHQEVIRQNGGNIEHVIMIKLPKDLKKQDPYTL